MIMEELSTGECIELLQSHHLGRVAVVYDGQPIIFPVNYSADGGDVVFRTDPGTKLTAGSLGRVAFEIDGVDESTRTGWSVVVQGVGNDITDDLDYLSEKLRNLSVDPWVPGERARWMRIVATAVTGRRLRERASFEEE
jgi:nitroimidazol reductase NimA-like FMN-containing flavoprotein (pyridoxamine 5'-phosphate oxidase superfamily)